MGTVAEREAELRREVVAVVEKGDKGEISELYTSLTGQINMLQVARKPLETALGMPVKVETEPEDAGPDADS